MNKFGNGFRVPEAVVQTQATLNQIRPSASLGTGFRVPEYVAQTQATLNQVRPAVSLTAVGDIWTTMVPHYDMMGVQAALTSYATQQEMVLGHQLPNSTLLGVVDVIQWMHTVKVPSVLESVLPLINTSAVCNLRDLSPLTSVLTGINWSCIPDLPDEETVSKLDGMSEEDISVEVRTEIANDVNQVLGNPTSAQELSLSGYEKWKQKNPLLADLFLMLVLPILAAIIGAFIQNGLENLFAKTSKDTQMYSEPTATAQIVQYVSIDQRVMVVGDVPYYHKVEFVDPETGEVVEGYIYKGNLIVDEVDESEKSTAVTSP